MGQHQTQENKVYKQKLTFRVHVPMKSHTIVLLSRTVMPGRRVEDNVTGSNICLGSDLCGPQNKRALGLACSL